MRTLGVFILGRYPYYWLVSLSNSAWKHPVNQDFEIPGVDWKTFLKCRTPEQIAAEEAPPPPAKKKAKPKGKKR